MQSRLHSLRAVYACRTARQIEGNVQDMCAQTSSGSTAVQRPTCATRVNSRSSPQVCWSFFCMQCILMQICAGSHAHGSTSNPCSSPLSHVSGIKMYVAQGRNTKQHTFQQSRSMCDGGKVCYHACEIGLACTKPNIHTKYAHRVHALASAHTRLTQTHLHKDTHTGDPAAVGREAIRRPFAHCCCRWSGWLGSVCVCVCVCLSLAHTRTHSQTFCIYICGKYERAQDVACALIKDVQPHAQPGLHPSTHEFKHTHNTHTHAHTNTNTHVHVHVPTQGVCRSSAIHARSGADRMVVRVVMAAGCLLIHLILCLSTMS